MSERKTPKFSIIVAATASPQRGIGLRGGLPWPKVRTDLLHFYRTTVGRNDMDKRNAIIMGRRTWESFPKGGRPLQDRLNIVLSRHIDALTMMEEKTRMDSSGNPLNTRASSAKDDDIKDLLFVGSLQEALDACAKDKTVENIFVIGGAQVYEEALKRPECEKVYLTDIMSPKQLECDTCFPALAEFGFTEAAAIDVKPILDEPTDIYIQRWIVTRPAQKECDDGVEKDMQAFAQEIKDAKRQPRERKSMASGPSVAVTQVFGPSRTKEEKDECEPMVLDWPLHPEEGQYLRLVQDVLQTGLFRPDRTETGTFSKFGAMCRYSLRDGQLPLLTTKRVSFKSVANELLWMVRGCTDAKELAKDGVPIWDGNSSREFLDKRSETKGYKEGDCGPIYGFQWRHCGATYQGCHQPDYSARNKGIDQLQEVIDQIKSNPASRRHLVCAWNPVDLPAMVLPPCHALFQFYVDTEKKELSCSMYQRSCDLGLGCPFNVASYSLLTIMVAHVCGLQPAEFIHFLGDYHVYKDHVEPLKGQLQRNPRTFPKLSIKVIDKKPINSIDDFTFEHFELTGYDPHPSIYMKMSV